MAYSSFCVEALAITKVSRLHASVDEKLACWTEGFSTADLNSDNFRVSLTGLLAFCIHSSWVCFPATIYRADIIFAADCREPSSSQGYQFISTHCIMTSSFHLSSFFHGLYFRRSRSVCENRRKFAPSKNFPLYGRCMRSFLDFCFVGTDDYRDWSHRFLLFGFVFTLFSEEVGSANKGSGSICCCCINRPMAREVLQSGIQYL